MTPKRPVRPGAVERARYALAWALRGGGATPKVRLLSSAAQATGAALRPGEVWLWVGEVSDRLAGDTADLEKILDEATVARLSRLARKQDRTSLATAHASARLLLGALLDRPANTLRLERDSFGKPHLVLPRAYPVTSEPPAPPAQPPNDGTLGVAGQGERVARRLSFDRKSSRPSADQDLHFNLSHTEGAVAVALAREPIGVDIERQRDLDDILDIADTVFAPETVAAIAGTPDGPQSRALFYRHWTLGEALIKATGGGMSHDLKSFAFTSHGEPQLSRAGGAFGCPEDWAFALYGVGE